MSISFHRVKFRKRCIHHCFSFTEILVLDPRIPISTVTRGQNRQKNSLKERVYINLALKLQSHIVKNTLATTILATFSVGNYFANLNFLCLVHLFFSRILC